MPTVAEPTGRRWTRAEYYQAADLGWFLGQRVELIGGEVIQMPAFNPPHPAAVALGHAVLWQAFGPAFWTRSQAPLHLPDDSEPEPDISVVPGGPRDYLAGHPTTALLVVEVSERPCAFDRRVKGSLYAAAGIQEYWIVNLVDRELEVYRRPVPNAREPHGFIYDDATTLRQGDRVTPLALPQASIAVADLLP